ncbi:MAG: T9SS type A sorting domain-containing protein [Ignavibacteriota bacterium]|nr:MAG: T9SS C-terminal target domain-containing protein [Chlorobiota bacterium]MBE7475472.1 T9SS type A sorting domain-containing protein [Ignavibacteriales bacterium]MBL1122439.1 T9SS C-terminal target domain-containing protein [Ignavibacteriota bacterium]MCE7856013.1 T9SS C-terminal target domain-containing protein [Ignavibacteria bacterium CHB3]NUM60704.1 T9SS type A sorting domain-containing protein [Ignavibacteriaceae bacterium]
MVDSSGNLTGDPVSVHDENKLPASFELYQNYPNPFNPSTKIRFSIPSVTLSEVEGSLVTLKIYDVLGNLVATLVNENKPAGKYEFEFNSNSHSGLSGIRELSSGIYFYRLQAGSFVETKKMILIR